MIQVTEMNSAKEIKGYQRESAKIHIILTEVLQKKIYILYGLSSIQLLVYPFWEDNSNSTS